MIRAAALLSSFVLPLALAQPVTPPATPKPAETQPAEVKPADVKPAVKPAATPEAKPAEPVKEPVKPADPYVLGHTMKDIDGKDQKLDQYKGKVVLIVNVASKCGLTPQYKSLQKLFDEKKDKGLVILGFPANDFAGQEPGKDADIKSFCEKNYGVTFPIFSKIVVKGDEQHALYKQLSGQAKPLGGDPSWNFTKFLVDKDGKVVARFEPRIDPSDATFVKKIDELLGVTAAHEPTKREDGKKPEPAAPQAPAKAK